MPNWFNSNAFFKTTKKLFEAKALLSLLIQTAGKVSNENKTLYYSINKMLKILLKSSVYFFFACFERFSVFFTFFKDQSFVKINEKKEFYALFTLDAFESE